MTCTRTAPDDLVLAESVLLGELVELDEQARCAWPSMAGSCRSHRRSAAAVSSRRTSTRWPGAPGRPTTRAYCRCC